MRRVLFVVILVALLGLTALISGSVVAQDALPKAGDLTAGQWNEIAPGGETTCAYGDAYRFFVRPAEKPTDKLMIYFAGGGACWNADFCAPSFKGPDGNPIFVSKVPEGSSAALNQGFFDYTNADNPVTDYNVVYLPYCTGDIHTGDKTQEYTSSSGEKYTMNHMGYVNATAALDWTYENYDKPSQVFLPGCSAGGYGSIYNAPRIMNHYKDTRVIQLGDASVGVTPKGWDGPVSWGMYDNLPADMAGATPDTLRFNDFYKTAAKDFPNNEFSEFTSYTDSVQIGFFYIIAGTYTDPKVAGADWILGMQSSLSGLRNNLPNFRAYQAWGSQHCVTPAPEFYTYQVNGVRMTDWVADLVSDTPPANAICKDCSTPEVYSAK